MSKNEIIAGLDVGSSNIRTVILQKFAEEENPRVVGVGVVPSFGVRRGIVVDVDETVKSINASLEAAERSSGLSIGAAVVNVGGAHLTSQPSVGVVAATRADQEITEDDVARALQAAETIPLTSSHEIIHVIPRSFSIDNQKGIKDPVGMSGIRIEVDSILILGSSPYVKNLSKCVHQSGVEIDSLVCNSLAAAKSTLNKRQMELGVIIIDIGGGTTDYCVYEEGELVQVGVVPIGGGHVTNDVAIGLRTSIDVAEKVKINYGSALPEEISKKDQINLSEIESNEEGTVSRHHVAEIIEARIEEIFTMIDKELRKTNRSGMLPGGAIIVGGTAKLPGIIDQAKKHLRLPAQTGFPLDLGGIVDQVDEPGFSVATGLALWGIESYPGKKGGIRIPSIDNYPKVGQTVDKMKGWFKKFLP